MGNYQRTQNSQNEGITLAHSLVGEPVGGIGGVTHAQGDVQPAGLHSTAPYVPPKRRAHDKGDKLLCSTEDCKAYPIKAHPYCAGHARSLGLVSWGADKKVVADGDTG
jgi:hypothetical protein